ncbi:kinase-like domain-containing protein [Scheffersomyces xylosifermentans]|uniref:kinase-like domain-containing protein n=1 Tax=Scheffersomyces xylosifermentans TaxID=1304137 RepID=UPI00315D9674
MDKQYQDRKRVFSGHISDVYSAIDTVSGKLVCLKIVDADFNVKPHNIRREIHILQNLKHPNILEYVNSYEHFDDVVLVTPFYEYTLASIVKSPKYSRQTMKYDFENPLNNRIETSNRLNDEAISGFIKGISSALQYIHGQGIIHRDVKPSNIYFSSEDITRPILGDFGISYKGPTADESDDQKFLDVSTGIFKAPELCLGVTDYGNEIDIWSLGIILTILYSPKFHSVIDLSDDSDEDGQGAVLSDLYLINAIFNNFGTPYIEQGQYEDVRPFWPELKSPKYHFIEFSFKHQPRKSAQDLIPRCQDERISTLFQDMTRYNRRISAESICQTLTNSAS